MPKNYRDEYFGKPKSNQEDNTQYNKPKNYRDVYFGSPKEKTSLDYGKVFNDMQSNPLQYYSALGGSKHKFNSMLGLMDYMNTAQTLSLPDNYTKYGKAYAEVMLNPTKYIDTLGSASKYNQALQAIGELFSIEYAKTAPVIKLVNGRVSNEFLNKTGLNEYYKYNPYNPDDATLAELGYAPSSFNYSMEDLYNKSQEGYRADGFSDAKYIGGLYQYDTSDPDDLLNQALGLMPKSFKYSNSIEDQIREQNGQLPEKAELYENNTQTFVEEYTEYAANMQEYRNALAAWENMPKSSQLVTEKPVNPYPNRNDYPASVLALMNYREAVESESAEVLEGEEFTPEQLEESVAAYFDTTVDNVKEPFFAFDENMPIMFDDFVISENYQEWFDKYQEKIKDMDASEIIKYAKDSGYETSSTFWDLFRFDPFKELEPAKGYIADMVYQDMYVEHLKETGEYEKMEKEWDETQQKLSTALDGEYTSENLDLLKTYVDPVVDLGINSGITGIEQSSNYSLMNAVYYNLASETGDTFEPDRLGGAYAVNASEDVKISDIANEFYNLAYAGVDLDEIGYMVNYNETLRAMVKDVNNGSSVADVIENAGGKGYSINDDVLIKWESVLSDKDKLNELTDLFNQADYRVMQLASADWEIEKKELEESPAWSYAIREGLGSGGIGYQRGRVSAGLEMFQGLANVMGDDGTAFGDLINQNAETWASQNQLSAHRASLTKGSTEASQFAFEASQSIGMMAPDLAIASITPAGQGSKALTGWKALGSKLVMNKNMAPFFISSLGRNLMEGELQGRTSAEKWLQALPAAYTEAVIEQQFGLFSGKSTLGTLIKNGAKGAGKSTLASLGATLLENTLGEAIEENLQDITTEFWRDVMYKGYEGQYPDLQQMGETALMAGTVGLLFSVFGLPANISNVNTARTAETSYNNAVAAYQSGDMQTFNNEMNSLKSYMQVALKDVYNAMDDGTLNSLVKVSGQSATVMTNLNEAQTAMKQSILAHQAHSKGLISAEKLAEADARANEAIDRIGSSINEKAAQPRTLYEQVANSRELTRIMTDKGYASELIRRAGGVMSPEQIAVIKKADSMAKANPYVNITFEENTTSEGLQNKVSKVHEELSTQKANRAELVESSKAKIEAAYKESKQQGKQVYNQIKSEIDSYDNRIAAAETRLKEAKAITQAFDEQLSLYAEFRKASNIDATVADGARSTENSVVNEQIQGQPEASLQSATEGLDDLVTPVNETQEKHNKMYKEHLVITSLEHRSARLGELAIEFPANSKELYSSNDEIMAEKQAAHVLSVQEKYNRVIELEEQVGADPTSEKITAARDKNIRQLLDMLDLKKIASRVNALTTDFEASAAYIVDKLKTYNWLDFSKNDGDYVGMLNSLNQALDVISKRTMDLEAASIWAESAKATMDRNAPNRQKWSGVRTKDMQTGKATNVINKAGYSFFGPGAQNMDQVALELSGNDNFNDIYRMLWTEGSEAYNDMGWLKTNDDEYLFDKLEEYKETLGRGYKKFATNTVGTYTLENGQRINLTLNDILAIHNNVRGGNNLTDGVRLSSGVSIKKTESGQEVWDEISSVLDDKAQGEQAEAIRQQIDNADLQNTREIADFLFEFVNSDTYTNKHGETIIAPKGRLDYGEFEVSGLKRAVQQNYWMRTKADKGNDYSWEWYNARVTKVKPEKVRQEDRGVVQIPNVIKSIDSHAFHTAHIMAYKPYLQRMSDALYTEVNEQSAMDKMRETYGEAYNERVKFYMQNIQKRPGAPETMKEFWKKIYRNARTVRLASISVYFKQLASIAHAHAYLDAKYVPVKKIYKGVILSAEQMSNIRRNAGSVVMRRAGYSLRETTEASGGQSILDKFMKPVTWFDTRAINYVYQWTENQVKAQNPTLKGEELNRAIAKEFRNVVEKTQPTFAPHSTSQFAQSEHFMSKLITMYSTATNSMYNTVVGGLRDLSTGHAKRGVRKLTSVFMSNAMAWGIGTALTSAIKRDKWEDQDTWSKAWDVGSAFTGQFYGIRTLTSVMKYKNISIPIIDEVTKIISDSVQDGGLISNKSKYNEAIANGDEEMANKYAARVRRDVKTISHMLANLAGVPLRSFESWVVKPCWSWIGGEQGKNDYNEFWGYGMQASSNYADLRKAIENGSQKDIEQLIPVIINKGGSLEKFLNAKTGGKGLHPELKHKFINTWKETILDMQLKEMQSD